MYTSGECVRPPDDWLFDVINGMFSRGQMLGIVISSSFKL